MNTASVTNTTNTDNNTADALLSLSYSSLNQFNSCPAKFMLSKCSDLPNERRNSAAALIGTAVHESFQYYLITNSFEGALKLLMMKYPVKLKKACTGKYHFLTAFTILKKLVAWYGESGLELVYVNGLPAVEFFVNTEYSVPDAKVLKRFKYVGFIDVIFRDKASGALIVCDIKTSSTTVSSEEEYSKYALSPQTVEYVSNVLSLMGYSAEEVREVINSVQVLYLICRFNGTECDVAPLYFKKTAECIDNLTGGIRNVIRTIEYSGWSLSKYFKSGNCASFGQQCPFFQLCLSNTNVPLAIQPQPLRKNPFNTKTISKTIYLQGD